VFTTGMTWSRSVLGLILVAALAHSEEPERLQADKLSRETLAAWKAKSYGLDRRAISKASCRIRFRRTPFPERGVKKPHVMGEWVEGRFSWTGDDSTYTWKDGKKGLQLETIEHH